MTAHPIAPMTDERLAELQAGFDAARLGRLFGVSDWRELRARLDAAEARADGECDRVSALIQERVTLMLQLDDEKRARKAAEDDRDDLKARALPPARLMRTVEDVRALPAGNYLVVWPGLPGNVNAFERGALMPGDGPLAWLSPVMREPWPDVVFARATVVGPLPDVEPIDEGDAQCSE